MALNGMLLYGFGQNDAEKVKVFTDTTLGGDVIVLTASEKEDVIVDDILRAGPGGVFTDEKVKVFMFLGMDDQQVDMIVKSYPRDGAIPRPIFCTLTPNNIGWTMKYLIEHLLEEQREMLKRMGK